MPNCFNIGKYHVYFWLNEGEPMEKFHVHISEGKPTSNATKIWITSDGRCVLCHNKSRIPKNKLRDYMEIIENNIPMIKEQWISRFGEITYIS
ncbi:MAG: DUF4160 domain-containing protein [Lachnospiraceae bacterium]|nr:DUF4160 domain-containing protein [Lachnospiraceae bacterium]